MKITKFFKTANGIIVEVDGDKLHPLSSIQKVKEPIPLFTTEDGVNKFDGNSVYVVNDSFCLFDRIVGKEVLATTPQPFKFFHSKEAAEEYILMNKPCLSLNDLLSVWNKSDTKPENSEFYKNAPLFLNFKELAKSKI